MGKRRGPCHFIDINPATLHPSVGINGKYTMPAAHMVEAVHRVTLTRNAPLSTQSMMETRSLSPPQVCEPHATSFVKAGPVLS